MGKKPAEKKTPKVTETKKVIKVEKKKKTKSKSNKKRISVSTKVEHSTSELTPKKLSSKQEKRLSKPPCKIAKCKRPYRAKGYCVVHYKKWRHGEYGKIRYKCCVEPECFHPMALNRFGYCEEHFTAHFLNKKPKSQGEVKKSTPVEKPAVADQSTAQAS